VNSRNSLIINVAGNVVLRGPPFLLILASLLLELGSAGGCCFLVQLDDACLDLLALLLSQYPRQYESPVHAFHLCAQVFNFIIHFYLV